MNRLSSPIFDAQQTRAPTLRPRRVTMRGKGWTETMTRKDKKMRRKEQRGTSNTPKSRHGSVEDDDKSDRRRCVGGRMRRTVPLHARRGTCPARGVGARIVRDSQGRGETVQEERGAVVRRRVVVAGNRMRAMMVGVGISAWGAIVREGRAHRSATRAVHCHCRTCYPRPRWPVGVGVRLRAIEGRIHFAGGVRCRERTWTAYDQPAPRAECTRRRARGSDLRCIEYRVKGCWEEKLATSAVDPTDLIASAPLSFHISCSLLPPSLSDIVSASSPPPPPMATDSGNQPDLCLVDLYASNPRPLFRYLPLIPPYIYSPTAPECGPCRSAQEASLWNTYPALLVDNDGKGTMAPRCSPIRAAYERDDAGVRTDREGILRGDAAYATPAEDYMRGVGRLRTDAVQADREDSRLVQVVCPLSRGTRVDGRHAWTPCGVRVPPESTEALLSAGIVRRERARARPRRDRSWRVISHPARVLVRRTRRDAGPTPADPQIGAMRGRGEALSLSSFGDGEKCAARNFSRVGKQLGRPGIFGRRSVGRGTWGLRRCGFERSAFEGRGRAGAVRFEDGLWTCMRAGRGTAHPCVAVRGVYAGVARVKRGGCLRRRQWCAHACPRRHVDDERVGDGRRPLRYKRKRAAEVRATRGVVGELCGEFYGGQSYGAAVRRGMRE
ncbi:hypothetical protein C8R44DRAFT_958059 [Mycena epipterygia]|nr:hypothetical protein C8R44DRAFT_958059 [Mycena epipterygia]